MQIDLETKDQLCEEEFRSKTSAKRASLDNTHRAFQALDSRDWRRLLETGMYSMFLALILLALIYGVITSGEVVSSATRISNVAAEPHKSDADNQISNVFVETDVIESIANTEEQIPDGIPSDYAEALRKARLYANYTNSSRDEVFWQLTTEYNEAPFSIEAAQYALDNVNVDWNQNALKRARQYRNEQDLGNEAIYQHLISNLGARFTPEQAQYAIDHLREPESE